MTSQIQVHYCKKGQLNISTLSYLIDSDFPLGTIQVSRHQRGGWVGGVRKWQLLMIYSTVNHQRWVGGPKKVKNMMT